MRRKISKRQEEMHGSVADRVDAMGREIRRLKAKDEDGSGGSIPRPTAAFVEEQVSLARTETLESVRDLISKAETRLEGSISSVSSPAEGGGSGPSKGAAAEGRLFGRGHGITKVTAFMEQTEENVARALKDIEKLRRQCEEIAEDSRKGIERCSRDLEDKIKDATESTKAAARIADSARESEQVAARALSIARQVREEISESRDKFMSFSTAMKR